MAALRCPAIAGIMRARLEPGHDGPPDGSRAPSCRVSGPPRVARSTPGRGSRGATEGGFRISVSSASPAAILARDSHTAGVASMERSDVEPAIGASGPGIAASVLLVLLLVGDLVYVAIHLVATGTTLLDSPLATLDVDRGYAEFFQYLKLLWACLLLACVGLRSRRWQYLAWVALFGYLLADDSLSLHENLGVVLADRLALTDA